MPGAGASMSGPTYWPDDVERARRLRVLRDAGRPLDEAELARRTARIRDQPGEHVNPAPALTQPWRIWHVMRGDIAVARATRLAESGDHAPADVWATIAGAHYAAANVRARPVPELADSPPPYSD